MCWKGLICELDSVGFTINYNVGLYIPGRATHFNAINCDFENHPKRAILVRGITTFSYINGEFLSSGGSGGAYATQTFLEFDGTDYAVMNCTVQGVTVRANDDYPVHYCV